MDVGFRAALVVAMFPVVALLSYVWLREGTALRRVSLAVLVSLLLGSLPFWLPTEDVVPRFFVALAAVLGLARVWETARDASVHGRAPADARRFAWYFFSVADLEFTTTADGRDRARKTAGLRLLRALLKAACLALLLVALSLWPLERHTSLLVIWCLFAAYCAATGAADVLTGLVMLLSGHCAEEVFRSPLLSRSPIEFWSQRWNLMFRNSAYRVIFVPVGGRRHGTFGALLVFAFSAAVHEYLVLATFTRTGGHMAAYFALQGVATLLNAWARKRTGKRLPRPLGVSLTWVWMVATGPLFFAPILDIFPLAWLRLA